ncbi:MAG: flagellar filament capping protein FliD [Eubacteriales bacterium]
MTNINSIQGSRSDYSAKGFTGLASGMNTEEVIEKLTLGIQNRIDRISKEETRNTWKQEAYRGVISSITKFQDKYFSFANPETNLLRTGLYNNFTRTAQGANADKVRMSNNTEKGNSNFEITKITQLAKQASYVGNTGIDSGTLQTKKLKFGNITENLVANKSIELTYDGVRYMVNIGEQPTIPTNDESKLMADILNRIMKEIPLQGGKPRDTLATKLKFTNDNGKLKLEATDPADNKKFSVSGGLDETLNALGLVKGVQGEGGVPINGTKNVKIKTTRPQSLEGREIDFDLNGQVKKLKFTKEDNDAVMALADDNAKTEKIAEIMNQRLERLFGAGKVTVTADNGTLKMKAEDPTTTLSISSPDKDTLGPKGMFPIPDKSNNRLDLNDTIASLGVQPSELSTKPNAKPEDHIYKINVNGREFSFKGDTRIADVIKKISDDEDAGVDIAYLNTTNKFSIVADETGASGRLEFKDVTGGNLAKKLFGKIADETLTDEQKGITAGQNLKMKIKYRGENAETDIERASNSVKIDNTAFEAKGTFEATTPNENITFKTDINTDDAVKTIKEMAEDYNKILEEVNKLITTKREGFKNKKLTDRYEPLTKAQRKEMTSKEIEEWEKKAKQGILFGDSALRSLLSDLRFAFSNPVANLGMGKDIGISTASSYSGNGKLVIDEKKLKEALTSNPEKVMNFFNAPATTNSNSDDSKYAGGFATRVRNIMESYAKTVGDKKGRLVNIAGIEGNATTKGNLIERQNEILAKKREALEAKLKDARTNYERRFAMMERYIARMNQQSSWLSQQ